MGAAFLGKAIATRLRSRGDEVRSFSRAKHPDLDSLQVEHVQGDLADRKAVTDAVHGMDAVFHVGAKAGVWGPYARLLRVQRDRHRERPRGLP